MFLQFKMFSAWGRLLIISILIIGLRTDRNFLQAQEEIGPGKPERSKALLFRNETRLLHSDAIGQDFEIHISFPVDYFINDTSIYPVLYCTDASSITVPTGRAPSENTPRRCAWSGGR